MGYRLAQKSLKPSRSEAHLSTTEPTENTWLSPHCVSPLRLPLQRHRRRRTTPISTTPLYPPAAAQGRPRRGSPCGAEPERSASAGAAGRGARRNPLRPVPTVPSSSSASVSFHRDLGAFVSGSSTGAPSRSLSDRAGGGGGGGGGGECWSCGASGAFLSCGSCGSVQPVDPAVDYFRIFGLERDYNIKDNNLEGKYKDWQKKLHPDLVHSKSEKEKAFAAEQSALVIDAYRTLSKPLSRALYLLQLEGIHIDEEKTITDPELLMEMMEIRESVNEASDPQTLEKIQSQIKRKLETWSNSFQESFNKSDFDCAVKATQRMRYYERAVEETMKKL